RAPRAVGSVVLLAVEHLRLGRAPPRPDLQPGQGQPRGRGRPRGGRGALLRGRTRRRAPVLERHRLARAGGAGLARLRAILEVALGRDVDPVVVDLAAAVLIGELLVDDAPLVDLPPRQRVVMEPAEPFEVYRILTEQRAAVA